MNYIRMSMDNYLISLKDSEDKNGFYVDSSRK